VGDSLSNYQYTELVAGKRDIGFAEIDRAR